MNKKGFTLVEILAVIVILSLISVIATTNVLNASSKSKEKLYCTKMILIKDYAKEYGRKYEKKLNESSTFYQDKKSLTITVNDLVTSKIMEPDKNNEVLSPLDNSSLNNKEIIIYLENNNINVYIDTNNICEI